MAEQSGKNKINGKAKEAAVKATGNDRMKAEGKMDQANGKSQEAASDVKDSVRGKHDKR